MNKLYRIIIFLLAVSVTACVSTQSNVTVAGNDEDKDIGLGGTGMLASTDSGAGSGLGGTGMVGTGSGLGGTGMSGTGIVGKITGFGSVFVNGIEIEYDNETTFTVDGKTAKPQQLEIGDVVEVLTTDDNKITQAQIINLRHEVIGRVESVEPQTFSFTVQGQSVVQAIDKVVLPKVGTTVAVSGFRIDEQTILSTRITLADAKQSLLRTQTDLPFKGKAARWLVQRYVSNDKTTFKLDNKAHVIELKQKTKKTLNDRLGIKIMKLQKPDSGELELDRVIEPTALPRGRQTLTPVKQQQPGINIIPRTMPGLAPGSMPGSVPGSMPGSAHGSMPGSVPGSMPGSAPGSMPNMKR